MEQKKTHGVATPGPPFSYATVEAALIAAYHVAPTDQQKFRARITRAQKDGLFGVHPGKGARLAYGPDEMHKLVLVCELAELGLSPSVQLGLIISLWEQRFFEIFKRAEAAAMHPPGGHDVVVILLGASLMVEGWANAVPNVNYVRLDQLARRLDLAMRDDDALLPRALMTNLTARLRAFHNALTKVHSTFEQPPAIETGSPAGRKTKTRPTKK
jgi:hypothetical protein